MKFQELSDQEKIQSIKDSFVIILEQLAREPEKLKVYFALDKPKTIVSSLETIRPSMTDKEKAEAEKRNIEVEEKAKVVNIKLEEEYNKRLEMFESAKKIISTMQKKAGCLCGSCLDLNIANRSVPGELEVLIDVARKEAEERVY